MNLDTPSLVVDSRVLERNIERMASTVRAAGVKLRPHTKTHKIPELALMQLAAGAQGITVAKVSEAEVMAAAGIEDIFIAYPLVTAEKIERALTVAERCRLIFGVDSVEGARRLAEAARARNRRIEVRLEIDTGMRRTGIAPAEAPPFARQIAAMDGIEIQGIFTFRGSRLDGGVTLDRRAAGLEEGRIMVELARKLRAEGIAVRDVSVGSTPTAEFACLVPGVTEVRPGTYIFNDRMQVSNGVCTLSDCALSVLVTVVSTPGPDRIIVDGGSKTFSTDAALDVPPLHLHGYGEVVGSPDLVLDRLSEEHGVIEVSRGHGLRLGDRLRIIPNHVCTTVNLHDKLWLSDPGGVRELSIAARGMVI